MKRSSAYLLAAFMSVGPAAAFECKFPKAPEANFKTYKSSPEPELRLRDGSVLADKGTAGAGYGRTYEVVSAKGRHFTYTMGRGPMVMFGDTRVKGNCR